MLGVGSVSVSAFPVVFAVGKALECLFICSGHRGAHQTVVVGYSHLVISGRICECTPNASTKRIKGEEGGGVKERNRNGS